MRDHQRDDVLVVGAVLVDDLDRPSLLLAARRTEPSRLAGGWELPGGKVEPGETPEEALHRELREELGVGVRLGRELRSPDGAGWPLPPSARLRVWLAVVTDGVPEPLEDHDRLVWLPVADPWSVAWLEADIPVVKVVARSVT